MGTGMSLMLSPPAAEPRPPAPLQHSASREGKEVSTPFALPARLRERLELLAAHGREEAFGLRGADALRLHVRGHEEPAPFDAFEARREAQLNLDRGGPQVADRELARHAGPAREDGREAQQLVEGRGEDAAVEQAGR